MSWTLRRISGTRRAGVIYSGFLDPMPRGYRYITLAAFGWLVLSGAHPPQRTAPSAKTEPQQAPSPSPSPSPTANPYLPYPDKYAERCYDASDHDAADLCAQWRAAIAAEKAAEATTFANLISGAGALLSFISVVLVVITLRQTRNANRYSEDTAEKELRAYLSFVELHAGTSQKGEWKIQVEWRNTGSTPANNAIGFCDWRDFPEGVPDDFNFPVTPLRSHEGASAIGPGQTIFTAAERRIPLFVVPLIAEGKANVVVWSSVDYIDIYGVSRRTEFATKLLAEPITGGDYGTHWASLHVHNGMDETCMKQPYADCPQCAPMPKN